MQEIHNGSTETVEFAVFQNNQQVQADGTVSVNLYDVSTFNAASAALVSTSATFIPDKGVYELQVGPSVTSLNRTVRADWSYSLNSVSATQSTFFNIATPYTTLSDIIDYYNLGTKPSDLNYKSPEQLIQLEKLSRTVINGYSGQNFGKRYGAQEVFGNGSDACFLTEPMLSLDKMYENDTLVYDVTGSVAYNTFGFPLEITQTYKTIRIVNVDWDVRYDNNIDPSVLYYGRFRNNSRYKFQGTIGWQYVPTDIQLCSLLLVGDLMANDAAWRVKYLQKVSMSEVSFTMKNSAFNGTGNLIVDNILDSYRNVNMVII